jgi:hypothetical protein
MPGPIKPSEIDKQNVIPEQVFEVFNELITRNWDGHQAVVSQNALVENIACALQLKRHEVFDRNLLEVEDAYRKAGWLVEYDKPAYNESYGAFFRFKKK